MALIAQLCAHPIGVTFLSSLLFSHLSHSSMLHVHSAFLHWGGEHQSPSFQREVETSPAQFHHIPTEIRRRSGGCAVLPWQPNQIGKKRDQSGFVKTLSYRFFFPHGHSVMQILHPQQPQRWGGEWGRNKIVIRQLWRDTNLQQKLLYAEIQFKRLA